MDGKSITPTGAIPLIYFLKLGGSLITDKDNPHTARMETIHRLAEEIREAQIALPNVRLIIGHGSGSFGHIPAKRHGTRQGVRTQAEWEGFVEVWKQARDLNQIVLDAFDQAGIPAIAFPPSAIIQSAGGKPAIVQAEPIKSALLAGLTPVVAGDVIFDTISGGTIFSTEDVFMALAGEIVPDRILLCGKDEGVCQDYPDCQQILPKIAPATYHQVHSTVNGSSSVDVTGGMREKVEIMLNLVEKYPASQVVIFSGLAPGNLYEVLIGKIHGTVISSD
ncbi:MAG: isopentenyl phosphate kinase [Bellilinea sp.]